MTTASSASCSTCFDCGGSRIASFGPMTDVDGFMKISGSFGTSLPSSAA
jgi:hypothetical protein